jgi:hypothetical protein
VTEPRPAPFPKVPLTTDILARIFHEHRDASSEKSACQRQGDLVAASPDKVGPSGANIPRLREMFGLARLRRNQR